MIPIGHDGRCKCTCADKCPLGRTGSGPRCTEEELKEAGIATTPVGTARPKGDWVTGTYIGNIKRLKGKTALLNPAPYFIRAQFDDVETGCGYGWFVFPRGSFRLNARTNFDEDEVPKDTGGSDGEPSDHDASD